MSNAEPITLALLATTAITGTLGGVTDRHLRSGLMLILQQAERGELPRNGDVAIAARRAQMLALRLSLRGYERLRQSSLGDPDHHITRPLSEFIHAALRERRYENLDRSTQATVIKQTEAAFVQPESPDGAAHNRQRAVRRLAEDWTLAEAHAQVRHATDWPRFETLMREGDGSDDVYVVTPAWWDAFRAFMAEEIRSDMRLATILTQRGLVEILGKQNDLNTVLVHMSSGQESWFETIAPALAALRSAPEQLKQNLERFDQIADEIARTGSLIQGAAEAANLGTLHSESGRRAEALAATAEAVACYRELVAKNRETFLPDLARSLNNLGGLLSEADALAATAEAVGFYRELVVKNRDAFLPDLARSLNDVGGRLSGAGREEEALAATAEAVGFFRELVVKNPDIFLPELVGSLNNLGRRLAGAGRLAEALVAASELAACYRDLVAKNRDAFLPDLARSLYNLAKRLSGAGRDVEALASNAEAVGLYRELVVKSRDAFLPELAVSLNNLASRLSNAGRGEEALAASVEAVELGRELVVGNPDAHAAALARACGSLGHALRAQQRLDEALISFSEGIETLDPLMEKHGEALAGLYDALADELIVTTEATGRHQEAAALRAQLNRRPHE